MLEAKAGGDAPQTSSARRYWLQALCMPINPGQTNVEHSNWSNLIGVLSGIVAVWKGA